MALLDFVFEQGLDQNTDPKVSNPGQLEVAENVIFAKHGRIQPRGGFQGTAADSWTSTIHGKAQSGVETSYGYIIATDLGCLSGTDTGVDLASHRHTDSFHCTSEAAAPYAKGQFKYAHDLLYAGSNYDYEWIASSDGVKMRHINTQKWTNVSSSTGSAAICNYGLTATSQTYGSGVAGIQYSNVGPSIKLWATGAGSSSATWLTSATGVSTSVSVQNYIAIAPYQTKAVGMLLDATNIKLFYIDAENALVRTVTYAHGLTQPHHPSITTNGTTITCGCLNGSTGARLYSFTGNGSGTWSNTPSATGAVTLDWNQIRSLDIFNDGSVTRMLVNGFDTYIDAGTNKTTHLLKRYTLENIASPTEVSWQTNTEDEGSPVALEDRPFKGIQLSRMQSFGGKVYCLVGTSDFPEPSNATALLCLNETVSPFKGDGRYAGVAHVQETPISKYWALWNPTIHNTLTPDYQWDHLPSIARVGSTELRAMQYSLNAQGDMVLYRDTWSRVTQRTLALRRDHATLAGGCESYDRGISFPEFTPIRVSCTGVTSGSGPGGSGAWVTGTMNVRCTIEVQTAEGIWESPATLPQEVTIENYTDWIDIDVESYCSFASKLNVYVAPPDSTTYYRATTVQYGSLPRPLKVYVQTVSTANSILYEQAEPARTYPGSFQGVTTINDRVYGWRNNTRLHYTHKFRPGQATQWAADNWVELPTPIQGIGSVNQEPVIICSDGLYALIGDGPDWQGYGSFSIRKLCNSSGCTDPRSVLTVDEGMVWSSKNGIDSFKGQLSWLGSKVCDLIPGFAAQHIPRNQLLFKGLESDGEDAGYLIHYDTDKDQFSTWTLPSIDSLDAMFAYKSSFALAHSETTAGAADCHIAFGAKALGGADTYYPYFYRDETQTHIGATGSTFTSAIVASIKTVPVKAGMNSQAIWKGVWVIGSTGLHQNPMAWTISTWHDGTEASLGYTSLPVPLTEAATDDHLRMMYHFKDQKADKVAVGIKIDMNTSGAAGSNSSFPSLTALTFDVDSTGNIAKLGHSNRA